MGNIGRFEWQKDSQILPRSAIAAITAMPEEPAVSLMALCRINETDFRVTLGSLRNLLIPKPCSSRELWLRFDQDANSGLVYAPLALVGMSDWGWARVFDGAVRVPIFFSPQLKGNQ